MVWGSEEVSESPSDSFGVQLKHHPLPSNNASQVSHSCVCNVNFYLEQRKQLFFWARFWSTFLNDPSFSLLEFSEQKQSTDKIANVFCSDRVTKHRKPRICFTWQIHKNYKAFFKIMIFRGSHSVYIHNASLYADRGWHHARCRHSESPIFSWYISL